MQINLNLATKPYLNRRAVGLWLLVIGAFLGVILAINLGYAYQNFRQVQQIELHLEQLNRQMAEAHGLPVAEFDPKTYAATMAQVKQVNELLTADQFRWTHLLGRMEELLPEDVRIRSIQPNFKQKSLSLTGMARDVGGLTAFMDALLASEDFHRVYLASQAERELKQPSGASTTVVEFALEIQEAF